MHLAAAAVRQLFRLGRIRTANCWLLWLLLLGGSCLLLAADWLAGVLLTADWLASSRAGPVITWRGVRLQQPLVQQIVDGAVVVVLVT